MLKQGVKSQQMPRNKSLTKQNLNLKQKKSSKKQHQQLLMWMQQHHQKLKLTCQQQRYSMIQSKKKNPKMNLMNKLFILIQLYNLTQVQLDRACQLDKLNQMKKLIKQPAHLPKMTCTTLTRLSMNKKFMIWMMLHCINNLMVKYQLQ